MRPSVRKFRRIATGGVHVVRGDRDALPFLRLPQTFEEVTETPEPAEAPKPRRRSTKKS